MSNIDGFFAVTDKLSTKTIHFESVAIAKASTCHRVRCVEMHFSPKITESTSYRAQTR